MKKLSLLLLFLVAVLMASAQDKEVTKTKFVVGVSGPELLHAGVGFDVTTYNQLGFTVGAGPTWGGVWPTLNAEHRLYFGKLQPATNRRKFFFRQGATYFTAGDEGAGVLSLGIDLRSKKANRGWTIDAGYFLLFPVPKTDTAIPFPRYVFSITAISKKRKLLALS